MNHSFSCRFQLAGKRGGNVTSLLYEQRITCKPNLLPGGNKTWVLVLSLFSALISPYNALIFFLQLSECQIVSLKQRFDGKSIIQTYHGLKQQ